MSRVMIMAGGTGGHVFPALAVAQALVAAQHEVTWMGTRAGLEASVVPQAGIDVDWVEVGGLRGKGKTALLAAPFRIARALAQAMSILRKRRPSVVLGMGGFVSGPGGVAARLCGKPLVVHEQNAVAGMTNRWLSRIATRVLEAFSDSFPKGVAATRVGNPVRADIVATEPPATRLAGRSGPVRLLVIGGSQGALALNETIAPALARIDPTQRPVVRHQAGRTLDAANEAYRATGVDAEIEPFIENMAVAYGWADLVICRAGALTVAELAAVGVPAIFVPFPTAADDHQTKNAAALVERGAARLIPQRELTPKRLATELEVLCRDRRRLFEMAQRAHGLAVPDATERVVQNCLDVVSDGRSG